MRVGKLLDAAPPACELSVAHEEGVQGRHWDMQVGVSAVGQLLAACAAEGRALDQVVYCSHEAAAAASQASSPLMCSAVLDARCPPLLFFSVSAVCWGRALLLAGHGIQVADPRVCVGAGWLHGRRTSQWIHFDASSCQLAAAGCK